MNGAQIVQTCCEYLHGSHFSGLTETSPTFLVFFPIFPVFFKHFVFQTENLINFSK